MLKVPLSRPDNGIHTTVKGDILLPVSLDHIFLSHGYGKLFFSDRLRGVISTMNLNGTGMSIKLAVWVSSKFHFSVQVTFTEATFKCILFLLHQTCVINPPSFLLPLFFSLLSLPPPPPLPFLYPPSFLCYFIILPPYISSFFCSSSIPLLLCPPLLLRSFSPPPFLLISFTPPSPLPFFSPPPPLLLPSSCLPPPKTK